MKKTLQITACMSLLLMSTTAYSQVRDEKMGLERKTEVNVNNPLAVKAVTGDFTTVEICHTPSIAAFENWSNEQIVQKLSGINGVKNVQVTDRRNLILSIENSKVEAILLNYFNLTLKK